MRMHASGWLIRYGLLCRKSAVMLAEGCWGDCVRTYKPVITNGYYAGAPEIDAAGQLPLPGWLWRNPIAILTGLVLGDGMRT